MKKDIGVEQDERVFARIEAMMKAPPRPPVVVNHDEIRELLNRLKVLIEDIESRLT
jgi:hypothetical protein